MLGISSEIVDTTITWSCRELKTLDLHGNQFTGSIPPPTVQNFMSCDFSRLDLANNSLEGPVTPLMHLIGRGAVVDISDNMHLTAMVYSETQCPPRLVKHHHIQ